MSKGKRTKIISFLMAIILIFIVVTLVIIEKMKEEPLSKRAFNIEEGKPMIGFSIDAMIIERWKKDRDIVKTKAEELGFIVEVVNAYESSTKQIAQIRTLVKEGAVAIFIIANDMNALSEVVAEAKKEGVIVIAYDRLIANANVDAYVSFDNIAVGEYMAKALIESVPKGNYVIINGAPTDHNAYMFNEGYYNILSPFIESGDITIVKEVWADDWREDFAYDTISELLQNGTQIDAIIGANDRLAEAAISVLSEYGLVGQIPVVGHDADVSACQKVVEGKQLMTVYKPIKNLAEGAVNLVYAMLYNKEMPIKETIYDGKYEVPYVKFDVIPVDISNMKETVIKDLFHSEEDVYRTSNDDEN